MRAWFESRGSSRVGAALAGLALLVLTAGGAFAQMPDKPLVVIRFQSDHVVYESALYNAMSRALEANPAMMFDVVVFAPEAQRAEDQPQVDRDASLYGQQVLASMEQMGLPSRRVTLSRQSTPYVAVPEVHVFVR